MHILELILCLGILSVCSVVAIPSLQNLIFAYQATASFGQIQLALNFARSVAVKDQSRVLVCPSADRVHCDTNWNTGILVISLKEKYFFHMPSHSSHVLTLDQSGFTTQRMTIEGNGLTNYNGSFNYTHRKHNGSCQFKLYFNKALRVYILKGG